MQWATFVLSAAAASSAAVTPLRPSNWHDQLRDRTWMVMFAVTGCKHCEQMRPMWEEMARQLAAAEADVYVGRVNSTKYNGLARTMRVKRFPTVLLVDPSGLVYEFNGRRGLPPLLGFAQGGYRSGAAHMMLPAEIEDDVSDYWLLAEALWPPIKQALTISLAIVLSLKACTKGLLWWLKRGDRAEAEAEREKDD
jgi:thiol-disulfide isomerase/thioredoxin